MARPLRIEYAGAIYHVMSRGNAQHRIFLEDADREKLLKDLEVTDKQQDLTRTTWWQKWIWIMCGLHVFDCRVLCRSRGCCQNSSGVENIECGTKRQDCRIAGAAPNTKFKGSDK
jgi:hypothetical protein